MCTLRAWRACRSASRGVYAPFSHRFEQRNGVCPQPTLAATRPCPQSHQPLALLPMSLLQSLSCFGSRRPCEEQPPVWSHWQDSSSKASCLLSAAGADVAACGEADLTLSSLAGCASAGVSPSVVVASAHLSRQRNDLWLQWLAATRLPSAHEQYPLMPEGTTASHLRSCPGSRLPSGSQLPVCFQRHCSRAPAAAASSSISSRRRGKLVKLISSAYPMRVARGTASPGMQ